MRVMGSNMNYSGSMQDCMKGCMDFEKKVGKLIPMDPPFAMMGSAYYTTPSQVKNPSRDHSCQFIRS